MHTTNTFVPEQSRRRTLKQAGNTMYVKVRGGVPPCPACDGKHRAHTCNSSSGLKRVAPTKTPHADRPATAEKKRKCIKTTVTGALKRTQCKPREDEVKCPQTKKATATGSCASDDSDSAPEIELPCWWGPRDIERYHARGALTGARLAAKRLKIRNTEKKERDAIMARYREKVAAEDMEEAEKWRACRQM
jgi:hypothetical protein